MSDEACTHGITGPCRYCSMAAIGATSDEVDDATRDEFDDVCDENEQLRARLRTAEQERDEARSRITAARLHLSTMHAGNWPDVLAGALATLDATPAPSHPLGLDAAIIEVCARIVDEHPVNHGTSVDAVSVAARIRSLTGRSDAGRTPREPT